MNTLFRIISSIKHYLFSNTLHGTHSPFVYGFLENVIYNTKQLYDEKNTISQFNTNKKYYKLIYRIAHYYEYNSALLIEEEANIKHFFLDEKLNDFTSKKMEDEITDLIYFGENISPKKLLEYYHQHKKNKTPKSIYIFPEIRKNIEYYKVWEGIIADEGNCISIDLFDLGILFFEQKKPKEHFKIYYK